MNERDLLAAGAVLPLAAGASADVPKAPGAPGTSGTASASGASGASGASAHGSPEVDVLVARGYRHPVLDDRVVVRLVPEALGEAEDLALEFLGFGAQGGERVGRVERQSLGFPAWALVNDPANGKHALAVVKEMERLTRLAGTKPGHAKDGFDEIATRLDRSVPHFLPTYYEQVARIFLGAESATYASSFFGKARDAERRHALAVDEERLREVFLEFAAAGALSGKTLREQAKGLAERLAPEAAFEQFRILCLERSAAGLAPYAGMVEDFRRLAKAAHHDVAAQETALVAELLHAGAITRAPLSFWKVARGSLAAAATADLAVRTRLLQLFPTAPSEHVREFNTLWLDLLDSSGAFTLLAGQDPAAAPASGAGDAPRAPEGAPSAAEWFTGWAQHVRRGYWRRGGRMLAELELVERFAGQLAREAEPVRLTPARGHATVALDLLDTCLATGVPVADPHPNVTLDLGSWLSDEAPGRRDLAAVAADPRWTPMLRDAVERLANSADGPTALPRVAADPVLGPVVGEWLAARAADLAAPLGLPELDRQLSRVARFGDAAVLATSPGAAAEIAAFDVAPVLARTLRAGVFDELGWPALDEAVDRLKPAPSAKPGSRGDDRLQLEDAWPALVVARDTHVVVAGPDGVLDDRVLTLPAPQTYSWVRTALRWIDGQWLIASGHGDDRRATWSGRPADAFRPKGTLEAPWRGSGTVSLPLSSGGRFYGTRPVLAGDTTFGERRPVASDGISYWVLHEQRWYEYDPAAASRGRASLPAFLDGALAEGGPGSLLVEPSCGLLPVQPGLEGSPFGSKDGLLGWWVRYDPSTRTLTACSVDGSRGRPVPFTEEPDSWRIARQGAPVPPLRLPGGAVLHPVVTGNWTDNVAFHDADGLELSAVEGGAPGNHYSGGTALVPPLWYWHALRPRDEAGSAVLRSVTDAQAAALLAALPDAKSDALAAVREVLPGITDPALAKGVAALAAFAATAVRRIAAFRQKLTAPAPAVGTTVVHARDGALTEALAGLMSDVRSAGYYRGQDVERATDVIDGVRALAAVVRGDQPAPAEEKTNPDNSPLFTGYQRQRTTGWLSLAGPGIAAAAARAATVGTGQDDRAALLEFLDVVLAGSGDGDCVLADPRGRLRVLWLTEPRTDAVDRVGEVRRDGGRSLLIVSGSQSYDDRYHWRGMEYAPDGAFGPWPGLTLGDEEVAGAPGDRERAADIARFAALIRTRGPVPYRPESAERFAELTGVDVSVAALLLLGMPGINGYGRAALPPAEILELAGLRPTRAATARTAVARVSVGDRVRLLARLVPTGQEAAERLWQDGFDAEALAEEWVAIHGQQRPLPIELVERSARESQAGDLIAWAVNPESRPELTGRTRQRMADGVFGPEDPNRLLSGAELSGCVRALRWLAYRLPYGDPLRAVLPGTLRILRERLADEGLLLDLGVDWTAGRTTAAAIRESHGLPEDGGHDADGVLPVGPAIVLAPTRYSREDVWLRTAAVLPGAAPEGGPEHPALVLLTGLVPGSARLRALRDVLGDELAALLATDGPAGAPQYAAHSVPELVAEAAERFGLSQDAAALYLMLLALPDPTDRQVTAWTDWKPARTKRARAELAATDLVVEAKRPRAGRTLFLPGGWLDLKAPKLPMEIWKAALFRSEDVAQNALVMPDLPVPELFRRAWQRVLDGDAPGFEEFETRGTGRKRGQR